MKHRSLPKPTSSLRNGGRFLIRTFFLALLFLLAPPSGCPQALEDPHVGYGGFLCERSHAYMVDDMGFDWLVWNLQWKLAEPSKGNYQWLGLDELLAGAETLGLKVILRVDSAPDWARSGPEGAPPDDMDDFGDFMYALASHAKGRVGGYVIWNEPNLPIYWGGSPSPGQYVQMLKAVYGRIKAADPDAAVITAGMATTGGPGGASCRIGADLTSLQISAYTEQLYSAGAINDLDFICGIYRRGGKSYFDVLGSHPYGFAYEPQRNPSSVGGLAFRRVERQRAVMESQGDGNKQIWAIEFGWILDPGPSCYAWGDWPTRTWQIVSERKQADYLAGAYLYARSSWPWMGVMSFFNVDFATVYWYDYCEPVRWYSVAYRQNHLDPGSPIGFREAYYTFQALTGAHRMYLPLGFRDHG